jgi:hypothetical protein
MREALGYGQARLGCLGEANCLSCPAYLDGQKSTAVGMPGTVVDRRNWRYLFVRALRI